MRKTDKKIDNQLCRLLTEVCDYAKESCQGFEFISHQVNYHAFPDSLIIECYFINQQSIDALNSDGQMALLQAKILQTLSDHGYRLPRAEKQIRHLIGLY